MLYMVPSALAAICRTLGFLSRSSGMFLLIQCLQAVTGHTEPQGYLAL